MAESELVTAVHEVTKLVQDIPRHYLAAFPDFRELNEAEIAERKRGRERKLFGVRITPAPSNEPLAEDQSAEAPALEGDN